MMGANLVDFHVEMCKDAEQTQLAQATLIWDSQKPHRDDLLTIEDSH